MNSTADVTTTLTDQEMAGLVTIFATFGIFLAIICLVLYIIDAIARFRYLKVRAYKSAWMAFIPLLNIYACVDATYGSADKINIFGVSCPAMVVKLYPIILSVITGITSRISAISSIGSTITFIISIIFGVIVYKDMLERIGQEISIGFSVLCNIISIVGSIKLLSATKGLQDGQYDYNTDLRVLHSQSGTNN